MKVSIPITTLKETYMYYDPTKNIVFIQQQDGTYLNKEGYTINELPVEQDDHNSEQFQLIDSNGGVVSNSHFIPFLSHEGREVKRIYFLNRKGREVDRIKIGVGHLTKGSIIEADVTSKGIKQFEVRSVYSNGPGSYCVETTTPIEDKEHPLYGDTVSFNITWITKIISRIPGVAVLSNSREVHYESHPRKYGSVNHIVEKTLAASAGMSKESVENRYFDLDKFTKRLQGMGLRKGVSIRSINARGQRRPVAVYDVKKAVKFLLKNQHWMFFSIEATQKLEAKELEKDMESMFSSEIW